VAVVDSHPEERNTRDPQAQTPTIGASPTVSTEAQPGRPPRMVVPAMPYLRTIPGRVVAVVAVAEPMLQPQAMEALEGITALAAAVVAAAATVRQAALEVQDPAGAFSSSFTAEVINE